MQASVLRTQHAALLRSQCSCRAISSARAQLARPCPEMDCGLRAGTSPQRDPLFPVRTSAATSSRDDPALSAAFSCSPAATLSIRRPASSLLLTGTSPQTSPATAPHPAPTPFLATPNAAPSHPRRQLACACPHTHLLRALVTTHLLHPRNRRVIPGPTQHLSAAGRRASQLMAEQWPLAASALETAQNPTEPRAR